MFTYCRRENAIVSHHIHGTWEGHFRGSLYLCLSPTVWDSFRCSLSLAKINRGELGVEWNLLLLGCSTDSPQSENAASECGRQQFSNGSLLLSLFLSQSHSHPSMQQIFADQWASSHLPSHLPSSHPRSAFQRRGGESRQNASILMYSTSTSLPLQGFPTSSRTSSPLRHLRGGSPYPSQAS